MTTTATAIINRIILVIVMMPSLPDRLAHRV